MFSSLQTPSSLRRQRTTSPRGGMRREMRQGNRRLECDLITFPPPTSHHAYLHVRTYSRIHMSICACVSANVSTFMYSLMPVRLLLYYCPRAPLLTAHPYTYMCEFIPVRIHIRSYPHALLLLLSTRQSIRIHALLRRTLHTPHDRHQFAKSTPVPANTTSTTPDILYTKSTSYIFPPQHVA